MPLNKADASRTIEVTRPPVGIPWWILALIGAASGIIIIGGVIHYMEERKHVR